jgi:hypothetical protein
LAAHVPEIARRRLAAEHVRARLKDLIVASDAVLSARVAPPVNRSVSSDQ